MELPKFQIGQLVKFFNDHDCMTGKVLAHVFHSENISDNHSGWMYKIASRFYDAEKNEMVEGHKLCREEELVDMTKYTGSTEPEKADTVINVSDAVNTPADQPQEQTVTA